MMSLQEARASWQDEKAAVIEKYGADDHPALSESWNNYTDMLCKDGDLTELQYQYCPAWCDDVPDEDEELSFILHSMGVTLQHVRVDRRTDGIMTDMDQHWMCRLRRGDSGSFEFFFSGGALADSPTLESVMPSLLMETRDVIPGDESVDAFAIWADEFGYESLTSAVPIWKAVQKCARGMQQLFANSELAQLEELVERLGL